MRQQRTIERPATVCGVGFLTGADITLRFLPAAADHGVAFQRLDLPGSGARRSPATAPPSR
jgi:UDP-3-O-acyl-N-acetylglucosamine deacetylase